MQPTPLKKEIVNTANRALYQRFMDLPRSERDAMQAELEKCKQFWHFKEHLCKDGTDLGDAKARTIALIWYYLGVSLYDLLSNRVFFVPYKDFVLTRQPIEQTADC